MSICSTCANEELSGYVLISWNPCILGTSTFTLSHSRNINLDLPYSTLML